MGWPGNNVIQSANTSQRWLRDRPLLIDGAFALLVFVVEILDLFASPQGAAEPRDPDVIAIVLVILGSASMIRRRQTPVLVMLVASCLMVVFYLRNYGSFMSIVGLAAFYAVAAHAENRLRAWIAISCSGIVLFVLASFTLLDTNDGFDYSGAAIMSTYIGLAVLVGLITRNREEIFVKTEARAERAEADRAAAAERAATQERLRIARELHDVVAHGMSVISVQAAAAQEIARSEPERAIELMKSVETTGRQSLDEMRRMLGILRNDERITEPNGVVRAPQPSLDDLEETIASCRAAGLETEFRIDGQVRPLSPGLELTIYRIVQEALTNVLKHGGSAAEATVELSYRFTTVMVRITDTGRGSVTTVNDSGNGLRGMRERVELYDGKLAAGPQPGGGYQVSAVLPFGTAARPTVASA